MKRAKTTAPKAGRYRAKLGDSSIGGDIAIVGLKEGGFGWRVRSRTGEPVKLNFGRIALPDDPKADSKLKVSMKAIDRALQVVSGAKAAGTGAKPARAARYSMIGVGIGGRRALRRPGGEVRRGEAD